MLAQLSDRRARALAKNRTYAFINIFGLALGLAACLMILLYVRYEMSYDAWLPGSRPAPIQFQTYYHADRQGRRRDAAADDQLLRRAARSRRISRRSRSWSMSARATPCFIQNGEATSTDDVRHGRRQSVRHPAACRSCTAIRAPRSTIPIRWCFRETEALKPLRHDDVVGQTLTSSIETSDADYRVTGVIQDIPQEQRTSRCDIVVRFDPTYLLFADSPAVHDQLDNQGGWYYARLRPAPMRGDQRRSCPPGRSATSPTRSRRAKYQPRRRRRIGRWSTSATSISARRSAASMTPGNDRRTIITFAVIALLILGMACVNFTNLATARAVQRAREVALRKVLGASRRQLIAQFIGESMLVAAIAMLIALALVELLPALRSTTSSMPTSRLHYFGADGMLLPILGLMLLVGRGRRPLSRFLSVALPAGAGAQGQQVGGRCGRVGPAAQRAGRRPVRGVDRADHLHAVVYAQTVYARTVDRRLSPRRPAPDRQHAPAAGRCDRAHLQAAGRTAAGRHCPRR